MVRSARRSAVAPVAEEVRSERRGICKGLERSGSVGDSTERPVSLLLAEGDLIDHHVCGSSRTGEEELLALAGELEVCLLYTSDAADE